MSTELSKEEKATLLKQWAAETAIELLEREHSKPWSVKLSVRAGKRGFRAGMEWAESNRSFRLKVARLVPLLRPPWHLGCLVTSEIGDLVFERLAGEAQAVESRHGSDFAAADQIANAFSNASRTSR